MTYENILALCNAKGISISALEKELGFGKSTIARWKTASPGAEKLKDVADYFGIPVDFLICGDAEATVSGKVVVTENGEAVCGSVFHNLAELVQFVNRYGCGRKAVVCIRIMESGDGATV